MPTPDPEADLAHLAATVTGRTLGTNLFTGSVLAQDTKVPADCLFIQALPGDKPRPFLGTGKDLRSADVKFTMRGPPGDREAARTNARALMAGVQRSTAALTGYSLALLVESEPAYEDYDSAQCHYYAFSLTLQWVA